MRRILFMVQKEFRQIKRTKAYFGLIFVAPFLMLLVMGSAITTQVKYVPVAVLDFDHSPDSRQIARVFTASSSFRFVGTVASEADATRLLDDGAAKIVVVVPAHFERDVIDHTIPTVQLLVDGSDSNSAGLGLGYVSAALALLQSRWADGAVNTVTRKASGGHIVLVPRMWYNPNLESQPNIVPGLIGILLIMITTFLTAINIVREKEIGTLEQLMVTPLGGMQLILGKVIPFTIMGFAQLTISLLAAGIVFGLWMKGSLLLFYGMAFIFFLSTLGIGIFVSTVVRTQQQAMFTAWFIMIFAILLSGFFVPIENMPRFVQYLTYINPLRYFITVVREIYLKGTEFRFLWKEASAMALIGVFTIVSAAIRFHKRVT